MNYPDLSDSKILSVDIETYDPHLEDKGLGAYRKDGYILGVSIDNDDGYKEYINLRHGQLTYIRKNVEFIRDVMNLNVPKLGVNFNYDLTWLKEEVDIVPNPNAQIHDILVAEPLIDENQFMYNLDSCAEKYLGKHKEKSYLKDWCKTKGLKGDVRKHLYLMSHKFITPYALADTRLPIEIFRKQWDVMYRERTLDLYHLEMKIQKITREMSARGVRIDTELLPQLIEQYEYRVVELQRWINRFTGFGCNVNSPIHMRRVFDDNGWEYPFSDPTKKMKEKAKLFGVEAEGNPSFSTKYVISPMAVKGNEFCKNLIQLKVAQKTLGTFLKNGILNNLVGDRLHGEFNALKSDDGGTVTGRFSAKNPNLQNIPNIKKAKDELSKRVRELFLPEINHYWCKADYKQIEVRVLIHFAIGEGSNTNRQNFLDNPEYDYHQWCSEMTGIPRPIAKNLNFGIMYGMGINRMVREYGFEKEEAIAFKRTYREKLPYLSTTNAEIKRAIKSRGHIRTALNRRRRLEVDDAYKGLNALIQGTAADIFKKAMVDAYEKGLFESLPLHLIVHDEDDVSVPYTKEGTEALRELQITMEQAIPLKVPVLVGCDIGTNWGNVKENDYIDGEYKVVEDK